MKNSSTRRAARSSDNEAMNESKGKPRKLSSQFASFLCPNEIRYTDGCLKNRKCYEAILALDCSGLMGDTFL